MRKFTCFAVTILSVIGLSSCGKENPEKEIPIESIELNLKEVYDLSLNGSKKVSGFNKEAEAAYAKYRLVLEAKTTPENATEEIQWAIKDGDEWASVSSNTYKKGLVDVADRLLPRGQIEGVTVVAFTNSTNAEFEFNVAKRPTLLQKVMLSSHDITVAKADTYFKLQYDFAPDDAEVYSSDFRWSTTIPENEYDEEDDSFWGYPSKLGDYFVYVEAQGLRDTCKIHVIDEFVRPMTDISVSTTSVQVNEGMIFSVTAFPEPQDATDGSVYLTINDNSIISYVSSEGYTRKIKAMKAGTATIVVKNTGATISKTINVTVNPPAVPEGYVDLGYRQSNGEPVFYGKEFLCDSNGIVEWYAWGDPAPYFSYDTGKQVWRDEKKDGYIAENYKWYGGKTGGAWSKYLYIKYPNTDEQGNPILAPEHDPVQLRYKLKFHTPNWEELLYLKKECWNSQDSGDGMHLYFATQVNGKPVTYSLPFIATYGGKEQWGYMLIPSDRPYTCLHYDPKTRVLSLMGDRNPWLGRPFLPVWRGYFML